MKKKVIVMSLFLLLLFFGTTTHAGSDLVQTSLQLHYELLHRENAEENALFIGNGYDWNAWSEREKLRYLVGILCGVSICQTYGDYLYLEDIIKFNFLDTPGLKLRYRAGQYMIELDVFYQNYNNMNTPLSMAFLQVDRLLSLQ